MAFKVRPLTWTLVALLGSNLLLGSLAARFIVQMDRHYSSLVATSLPLLNDVRSVAWEVTVMQRSINRYPNRPPAERQELFARAEAARVRAAALLDAIRKRPLSEESRETFARMVRVQEDLDGIASRWRQAIRSGDLAAAEQLNLERLQPRYVEYTSLVEVMAAEVETHGRVASKALSADAGRFQTILLGMATWPLWLGVVAGVLALAFFVSLAPLLRRLDS